MRYYFLFTLSVLFLLLGLVALAPTNGEPVAFAQITVPPPTTKPPPPPVTQPPPSVGPTERPPKDTPLPSPTVTATPDFTGTAAAQAQTATFAAQVAAARAQATALAAQTANAASTKAAEATQTTVQQTVEAKKAEQDASATSIAATLAAQTPTASAVSRQPSVTPPPAATATTSAVSGQPSAALSPTLTPAGAGSLNLPGAATIGVLGILILIGLGIVGVVAFSLARAYKLFDQQSRAAPSAPRPASPPQATTAPQGSLTPKTAPTPSQQGPAAPRPSSPAQVPTAPPRPPLVPAAATPPATAPMAPPSPAPRAPVGIVGQVLNGRYAIQSAIGAGGMGSVYRAHDQLLNRWVAIKECQRDPHAVAEAQRQAGEQFLREAQILANLNHPNLPRVTDFFSAQGREYLVMDFAEGSSLEQIVAQRGILPEALVTPWAHQLLDALAYIHARSVIHRDIKPQNIILAPDGRVMLVDFGLVKILDPNDPRTASVLRGMGTVDYAPLEQYGGGIQHTDARTDIYSLGATLYFLVTGQPPMQVYRRILDPNTLVKPRAVNPTLSARFEAALLKAIEIHPQSRFQSAQEMRMAL